MLIFTGKNVKKRNFVFLKISYFVSLGGDIIVDFFGVKAEQGGNAGVAQIGVDKQHLFVVLRK